MKRTTGIHTFSKALLLAVISCITFVVTAKAGVDSYSIYLNNKLLVTQSLNKPLTLQNLQLENGNANDELIIYYSQCNAPNKIGSGRSIVIKDSEGKKIKEWSFGDVKDSNAAMRIPVREVLALQKKNGAESLVIFYHAENMPKEQMLARL